jgi:hypothetical protein
MHNVTYLDGRKSRQPQREAELRRLALQLAVQLPEDTQEALDTIEHLRALVRSFMGEPVPL